MANFTTSAQVEPVREEVSQKYTLNDVAQELTIFSRPSVQKPCRRPTMGQAWKMKLRRIRQLGFGALTYIHNLTVSVYLKHIRFRSLQEHQKEHTTKDGEAHRAHPTLSCLRRRSATHRINQI